MRCRTSLSLAGESSSGLAARSTSTRSSSSSRSTMRGVAGGERGLPIEAVGRHELFGAGALARDVHRVLIVGTHQLDEHHLRALEVIAEIDEQDALAEIAGARRAVRRTRQQTSGHERRADEQHDGGDPGEAAGRQQEPGRPPAARALEIRLEPRPTRCARNAPAARDPRARSRRRPRAPAAAAAGCRGTPRTTSGASPRAPRRSPSARRSSEERARLLSGAWSWPCRCPCDPCCPSVYPCCFLSVATNGSSAARILRTARKMLCLVAFVLSPSDRLMSSIEWPSKCRSTKAARSRWLSADIAVLMRS